jgi:hypothetical protein
MSKTLLQQADMKPPISANLYMCGSRTARAPTPLGTHRARGPLSRGPTCQKRLFKFGNRTRSFLSTRIPIPFISILSHSHLVSRVSLSRAGPAIPRRFVLLLAPPPATPAANRIEVRSLSEIQRRPAISRISR